MDKSENLKFKAEIQTAEKSGYFSILTSLPYRIKAEVKSGKSKRRSEYPDDIPIAKTILSYRLLYYIQMTACVSTTCQWPEISLGRNYRGICEVI